MAVRWRRSAFLQLALLIGVAARTVYAAPAGSMAQLRAACCCATHCSHCTHRPGALQSDQCCGVASGANDAAVLASPFALHPPLDVHSLTPSAWAPDHGYSASPATAVEFGIHGPPLFLKVRSLRL